MIEKKLFKHKVFKINGVRFAIKKISPSLFMDKDYIFPMTSVIEKSSEANKKLSEKEILEMTESFKDKMKDAILKGVVYVKSSIFSKKQSIKSIIDDLMGEPEIYSYLYTLIVNHSLGVKKNYSHHFNLTKTSLKQFI